jgi:hypothetical protein
MKTSTTPPPPTDQIWYFGVTKDRYGRSVFRRIYADLEKMEPHRMEVRVRGDIYIIESEYVIPDMMLASTRVLLGFVYVPPGKRYGKLFPLPEMAEFTPDAATVTFPEYDFFATIYNAPEVVRAQSEYTQALTELRQAFLMRENVAQTELNTTRALSLKTSGEKIGQFVDELPGKIRFAKEHVNKGFDVGERYATRLPAALKNAIRTLQDPGADDAQVNDAMQEVVTKLQKSPSRKSSPPNLKRVRKFFPSKKAQ